METKRTGPVGVGGLGQGLGGRAPLEAEEHGLGPCLLSSGLPPLCSPYDTEDKPLLESLQGWLGG